MRAANRLVINAKVGEYLSVLVGVASQYLQLC